MLITTDYNTLTSTMATVSSIVSDKLLQEDFKNVIIWVKEGVVRFGAFGGNVSSATETTAEASIKEGEHFFQLKAKDINDVLNTFTGLKRTVVTKIEIQINDNDALMTVYEEAMDEEITNAEAYNQASKYRITKPRLKDIVKAEIQKVDSNKEGVTVETGTLLVYINALYPTVAKETRESSYNVMFDATSVYTVPAQYAAIMPNKLPDVFQGFRLSNSMINFLKNFIGTSEEFTIGKEVIDGGAIFLTVTVGDSIATIKCPDMSRAYDMTNFLEIPPNAVAIDKGYLKDVLKRIALGNEPANVDINIGEGGMGLMRVTTKAMTQNLPVLQAKGVGSYSFQIKADLLSTLIFSHVDYLGETVYLYLDLTERGTNILAVKDNTNLWHTKITGLTQSKGDFDWSRQTQQ